jgi:carboxylesterase type B
VEKVIGPQGKRIRHAHQKPRILVHQFLREAIQMETLHAANIFAKIVAPFATRLADAAGRRAIGRDMIADFPARHGRTKGSDFADRFRAHRQRQVALGEGHAAKAPNINMVQRHGANAKLHLMRGRWRRWRHGFQPQIAIPMQTKGAHHCAALSTRQTFCPPKPKELDSTWRKPETRRASFGTTSNPSVGSGST